MLFTIIYTITKISFKINSCYIINCFNKATIFMIFFLILEIQRTNFPLYPSGMSSGLRCL